MKTCICTNNLLVLVIGCPIGEISTKRPKQGDPLATLLFLLVVKSFEGLTKSACRMYMFKGYVMGDGCMKVSHCQYRDDTL